MGQNFYTVLWWPQPMIYTVTPSRHAYRQSGKQRVPVVVRRKLTLTGALRLAERLNHLRRGGQLLPRARGSEQRSNAADHPGLQ